MVHITDTKSKKSV